MCELHNDKQRRNALESLPPTLPKTYERILARVNETNSVNQKMVQRVLKWVAYAYEPLSLSQLAEIISVEESDQRLDPEMIVDRSAIIKWCSSLLRLNDRGFRTANVDSVVEFSHFTVKEYLTSIGPESDFQVYSLAFEDSIHSELAKKCLRYLCLENFASSFPRNVTEANELKEKHPFQDYAILWPGHRKGVTDKDLSNLSRKLFDPSKSHNFMCWAQALASSHYCRGDTDFPDVYADSSTLHWACMMADPELCRYLIELMKDVNKPSKLGTPLQCAVLGTAAISWGYIYSCLQGTDSERAEVIDILLTGGAELHTIYQPQDRLPVTLASLTLDTCVNGNIGPSSIKVLIRAGMTFDRLALLKALNFSQLDVFAGLERHNLKQEDTIWYIEHYLTSTKVHQDAMPMMTTEAYLDVRDGDGSKLSSGKIEKLLIAAAEIGQNKVISQLIKRYELGVNLARISDRKTALHLATSNSHLETIRLLLQLGADRLRVDATKETPLHLATHHADGAEFQILLRAVNDVTQKGDTGLTALHEAAYFGNLKVLSILQQRFGNEPFERADETKDGRTLLLCACQSGSIQVIEFLVNILGLFTIQNYI